jgi:hypothetical protein
MPNQMIALQARNPQLPDPARATSQMANMMNMASQQRAAQLQSERARQEMDFARAGEAREAELQPARMTKAQSEADSARLKYVMDYFDTSTLALAKVRDPQQAMAVGQRIKQLFPEPELQAAIDETLTSIPQDPAQFEAWREDSLFRTMEAKDQLAREFKTQTTGSEQREISYSPYGRGGATEVPGSRISVAEGMQYVKTDTGDIVAVPKETGGGFGTPTSTAAGDTFKIMIGMESGGKQFAKSGAPLTSPKGAIGIAQIMPGTAPEAAKLAGLPYDKARLSNDRDYNLALGEAYFKKQLADFGDPRLAAAAYNAGPGAVRRALAKGGPDGWVNHVPRETQKYVASIPSSGGANSTGAAPTGPTVVVKGSGAKAKPSTEGERRFGTVAQNMTDSMKEATAALVESPSSAAPGTGEYAASLIPFYGDEARKFAQSGPRQRFEAALLALLDGVTYINTGAGTSKTQEANYKNTYIPTYQDTPKSRKAKLERAIRFIENSKDAAGVMWTPEIDRELKNLKTAVAKINFGGGAAKPKTPTKSSDGWGSAKQVGN